MKYQIARTHQSVKITYGISSDKRADHSKPNRMPCKEETFDAYHFLQFGILHTHRLADCKFAFPLFKILMY